MPYGSMVWSSLASRVSPPPLQFAKGMLTSIPRNQGVRNAAAWGCQ
jgi:hypothetical protein